jgi:hypothetical protein
MVVDEVKTLSTLAALAELGIREPRASATALHQIESVCSFWRDYGFSAEMAAVISDEDLAAAELPSVVFH